METVLKIKIAELNTILINALKKAFAKDHSIEISIKRKKARNDFLKPETKEEYFVRLRRAIENIEKGDIISFTGEEFEALSQKLLKNK